MTRITIPGIGLALSAACLTLAAPASATQEDTQYWGFFEVDAELGSGTKIGLEFSPRFTDDGELAETRLQLKQEIADGVELGGGIIHGARRGGNEWRPFQQIELKTGPFESRTRMEQRLFPGADRPELRLRQRLLASHEIGPDVDIVGDVELLYILQDQERGRGASIDNWRFTVAVEHGLRDNFDIGIGYMLMLSPNGAEESEISHVPQIMAKYSF